MGPQADGPGHLDPVIGRFGQCQTRIIWAGLKPALEDKYNRQAPAK